jgi:hypothetical protein
MLLCPAANSGGIRSMTGTYLIAALVILVLVVVGYLGWRTRQVPVPVQRMRDEDGNDPLKRWARGCYAVLYGGASPDRRGAAECRQGLAEGWNIRSGQEILATIDRLSQVPTGRVAWDLVRVVAVARLGAAAGFISMDQAQAAVGKIQRRLQGQYPGWEEMAADYDAVVREKGLSEDHLQGRVAAQTIWQAVPFR